MWVRTPMRKNDFIRAVHPEKCTTQTSIGAAPRPFRRRPTRRGKI